MTRSELRTLISQRTDRQLLAPCLLDENPPYIFDSDEDVWNEFRDCIVERLSVSRADIRIVGSARLGYSMKPGSNLRMFKDNSDIDLVIVSAVLFDQLWISLLAAAYPRKPVTQTLSGWLERRRNELYTGWLTPAEIRLDAKIYGAPAMPVLAFRTKWFNTLKEASQFPVRRYEDINGRLYRTWQHAELYHLHSIALLRQSLIE